MTDSRKALNQMFVMLGLGLGAVALIRNDAFGVIMATLLTSGASAELEEAK